MEMMQKIQMASEDVKSYLHTGVFYNSGDQLAEVADGACVVIGDLEDHDTYKSMKDINARKIKAPTATTDKVAIVDYVGVSQADVMGVTYRIGDKVFGLKGIPGERVRVRDLIPGDEFWLCEGNFASTPTVGQYAIPTASSTKWTPAASQTADTVTLKIETTKTLITGQVNDDNKMYFCRVMPMTIA